MCLQIWQQGPLNKHRHTFYQSQISIHFESVQQVGQKQALYTATWKNAGVLLITFLKEPMIAYSLTFTPARLPVDNLVGCFGF